jgi:hypothetical protein
MMEPQVVFRNMDPSAAVLADVQRRCVGLARLFPDMIGCHIAIEAPHRHHRHGYVYRVRIDVTIPGAELVVGRNPPDSAHADVYVAVRDAFRAARRELTDARQLQRGQVKHHVSAH